MLAEQAAAQHLMRILRIMLDEPDQILVNTRAYENSVTLRVVVAPTDIGKVIGKHGRNAAALREIISALGHAMGHRFFLDIDIAASKGTE